MPDSNSAAARIGPEAHVTLHFALKLEDGDIVDSNFEDEPVSFRMGDGNLPPGFEQAICGLKAGDQRTLTLSPEQGFGMPNPANRQIMPLKQFQGIELEPGLMIMFQDASQSELPGVVVDIDEDAVTVDFNHPLAGKTLQFEVQILDVEFA